MLKTIVLARRHNLRLPLNSPCKLSNTAVKGRRLAHAAVARAGANTPPVATHSPTTSCDASTSSSKSPLPQSYTDDLKGLMHKLSRKQSPETIHDAIQSSPLLSRLFSDSKSAQHVVESLAQTSHCADTVDSLKLAYNLKLVLHIDVYENVCFHLAASSRWDVVLKVTSLAIQHKRAVTTRLLNWRVRALIERREFRDLLSVLDQFAKLEVEPNRRTFHLLISGFLRNNDLSRAQECLRLMKEYGIPIDASTHAAIARHYHHLGLDEMVEKAALDHLSLMDKTMAVIVLNSFIRTYLANDDISNALRLLSMFDPSSVEDIVGVLCGDNTVGNMVKTVASHVLPNDHLSHPLTPNASTFSILIYHCGAKRNIAGAFQLFSSMMSQGIAPNEHTITSLVSACSSGRRPDLAVQLVAGICDAKSTPRSLFDPIYPDSWPEHCFEIHSPDIRPSVRIFNALIRGVLQPYGFEGATAVLEIMKANQINPDEQTLSILMRHLDIVEKAHPRTLLRLLNSLSSGADLKPTLHHFRRIFRIIYGRNKFLLHGTGWNNLKFSQSISRELPESRKLQSEAFDHFAGIGFPEFRDYDQLSKVLFEKIESSGVNFDRATTAMRIRYEAVVNMDMEAANVIFRAMLSRGMQPNAFHFGALIEGYAIQGDAAAAEEVMASAMSSGVVPNAFLYTTLIVAYGRRGDPNKAAATFKDMVESGIDPDVPSIDAVAAAFYAVGSNGTAKQALISLWPYIEPFPAGMESKSVLELARHFRTLHKEPKNTTTQVYRADRLKLHLKLGELVKTWQRQFAPKIGPRLPWNQVVGIPRRRRNSEGKKSDEL